MSLAHDGPSFKVTKNPYRPDRAVWVSVKINFTAVVFMFNDFLSLRTQEDTEAELNRREEVPTHPW